MLNISEMMTDPDFVSGYILRRPSGSWIGNGVWEETFENFARVGCIQPARNEDVVQFLPEGERNVRAIRVWDKEPVLAGETPDLVTWQDGTYRVVASKPWAPWGYYYAIATEFKDGDTIRG